MNATLRRTTVDLAWALGMGIVVFLLQAPAFRLNSGITPVWLAGGVTAGVLGALPRRRWAPFLIVFSLGSGFYYVATQWPLWIMLMRLAVDAAVVIIVALALQRTQCLPPRELRDAVALAVLGSIAAVVRFAVMGIAVVFSPGRFEDPLSATTNVYLNSVLAVLAITPMVYLMVTGGPMPRTRTHEFRQGLALLVVWLVVLFASFIGGPLAALPGTQYLIYPVLIYAALTVGPRMASILVGLTVFIVTAATLTMRGPFAVNVDTAGAQARGILQAQSLLLLLAASVWLLLAIRSAEASRRQELERLVNTDLVTDLYSRTFITQVIDEALAAVRTTPHQVAVMFVDLTEFMVVNRSLGFEAGDAVLAHLAHAVRRELPDDYVIGRFDGHHLVVVVPRMVSQDEIEGAARRVLDAVAEETEAHGHRLSRTGSIGIAISGPGATSTSLLRDANQALIPAKAEGRSRVHVLTSASRARLGARELELEHELRIALDERQFTLHFQPQVQLADSTICGYEALVRWQHPERGLLAAGEFIPVMESSGLVVQMSQQVLEMVCETIRSNPGLPGPISMNVSAIEFAEPDWLERLTRTIRDRDVSPSALVIEMTETTIVNLTGDARRALDGLRELGIGVHIDDFGSGYASVGALRSIPVTGLKLDQTFVAPLTVLNTAQFSLVNGIAALADGLGLEKIAEGIETQEQANLALAAGWTIGQGYFFGRPSAELVTDLAIAR